MQTSKLTLPNPGYRCCDLTTPKCLFAGFSLVELLVVIAIISLMSLLAIAGLGSVSGTAQTNQAMSYLGGVVDFSRQYAIAQNTYTYVAFSQTGDILTAVVFASRTGRPLFDSINSYPDNSPDIIRLTPPKEVKQMVLAPDGTDYGGWTPPPPPAPATGPNRSWSIRSQGKTYDAIVGFTPSGAASVTADQSLNEVIEFGLLPVSGDGKKGFVVRISGLTGLNRILRP